MAISTIDSTGLNNVTTISTGSATLTLPASTGTLLSNNNPQSGGVIQVVQGLSTTYTTTTSTSYVTTTVTANITPKFSTSKILIMVCLNGVYNTNTGNSGATVAIFKNGSSLSLLMVNGAYIQDTHQQFAVLSGNYLDSPATTSSITYAIYFKQSYSGTVICQNSNEQSSITLMEIAAWFIYTKLFMHLIPL